MTNENMYYVKSRKGNKLTVQAFQNLESVADMMLKDRFEEIVCVYDEKAVITTTLELGESFEAKLPDKWLLVPDPTQVVMDAQYVTFVEAMEAKNENNAVLVFSPTASTVTVDKDLKNDRMFLKMMGDYFSVHESSDYIELETSTNGGVNMFYTLHKDSAVSFIGQFEDRVQNFEVDEEIEVHRQDATYRSAFSIRASLEDFEEHLGWLEELLLRIDWKYSQGLLDNLPDMITPDEVKEFIREHHVDIEVEDDSDESIETLYNFATIEMKRTAYTLNGNGVKRGNYIFVKE